MSTSVLKLIRAKYGSDKHPALVLAQVAFNENEDTKLRMDASKALLPYCEASHKSIEVRGHVDHTVGLLRVNLFDPKPQLEHADMSENMVPSSENSMVLDAN